MAKGGGKPHSHARQEITAEAARIMAEEGVQDFQAAKRKAAGRLNFPESKNLPSNLEVEQALHDHLRLFHAELPRRLQRLRAAALDAMRFLHDFDPRLVGMVLSGTVTDFTPIQLHLTADTPEDVALFLQSQQIPYEAHEKRLRFGGDRFESYPGFRFHAGEERIEVCVFSRREAREAPLSPVDGKPMRRANLRDVEQLVGGIPAG